MWHGKGCDGDGRADLLLFGERLARDGGHVDHDDDALGGVGHGGGHRPRGLDGHGGELVVPVEGHAGHGKADLGWGWDGGR